ncbi:MAG: IclR family transcriptional regulator [Clostridiales Family XIII bacterium]|jgi:IclR family KDG regulon transcriptional repressor|nr:IclR family transcriptional regulator [Clostridiales Family XIII bacterium]
MAKNLGMENTSPSGEEISASKSIVKALSILDLFAEKDELGVLEIGERTGLPASTVQRIVNSLVSKQYLSQNTANLKYRLGLAFFKIISRYSQKQQWVDVAVPMLEQLAGTYQETVNLGVLRGESIVLLAKVDSPFILRPNFNIGIAYEAANSSLWRCLCAYLPADAAESLITGVKPTTPRSITDPAGFRKLFETVRAQGYAIEDEEFQVGLFCIAAPIKDGDDNVIAAISLSIPKTRLDIARVPEIIQSVCSAAESITTALSSNPMLS